MYYIRVWCYSSRHNDLLLFPELGVGVGRGTVVVVGMDVLTVVSVTEMINCRVNTASTVNRSTP